MSDDPRDALLAVAREIIAKRGYVGLTLRTASAAAGVTEDVALRYYRNRDSLFAAAMRLPVDPVSAIPALMAPGIEGMGERLVRFTLDTLRDPAARDDLMSLARTGVSAGQAVTGIQEFIEIGVVDRVAGMIGVPDARMRSALITSYLLGVATMRYGVRLEPLASASDEEVIRMVAPVIQDLLDPRRPIPGSSRARARTSARSTDPGQPSPTGTRARTFDPDPEATRAAEAARLAAQARTTPTGPTAAPRTHAPGKAATTSAAKPVGREAADSRAATVAATPESPTGEAATKPTPKLAAATGATRTKSAAARKPTTKKPVAKNATAKNATAKRSTAKRTAVKRSTAKGEAASAAVPGPRHAQVPAEPAPSDRAHQ